MLKIDRESPVPLHHQLREIVARQIRASDWAPHELIPTETEWMAQFGVSRITVRQALSALVAEGLLYRKQGKGTFVAPAKIAQSLDNLVGFTESLFRQGLKPEIHLLSVRQESPSPEVAHELGMGPGVQVMAVQRRVDVQGEPLFWDQNYFPALPGLVPAQATLESGPLLAALETVGYRFGESSHTMAARLATLAEAALLQLEAGSPVMVIRRRIFAEGGDPVVYSQAVYRSDRYEYQIRLHRNGN